MHLQICFFDFQICKPIPGFRPAKSKSGNALAHVVLHIDTCRMHVHVVLWSMRAFALLLDISSLQLHSYLGSPSAKCPQYKKCSKYKDLAPFWGAADMRATFPPTLPTLALQAARLAPERMHTHVASQSCVFPPSPKRYLFQCMRAKTIHFFLRFIHRRFKSTRFEGLHKGSKKTTPYMVKTLSKKVPTNTMRNGPTRSTHDGFLLSQGPQTGGRITLTC